ncbi:MAG: magnesium transporter CorA family protein [Candidatus Hydrogenedentes bacterium]|nr:magnesium transporter CorA family protein [Candidatus Hydrogenedentota bacterium]
MIRAYLIDEQGETRKLDSLPALKDVNVPGAQRIWIDVEEPAPDELAALAAWFPLDAEALDDCVQGEQRPRVDEFDTHIFLVLYGAGDFEKDEEFTPHKIGIFFSERFVITVHAEPMTSIRSLRERCEKHADFMLNRGMDFLLYSVIDHVVDRYALMIDALEDKVELLEDQALAHDARASVLETLSDIKRDMIHLRRVIMSQREVIEPFVTGEYDYIAEALASRFLHVRDHLTKNLELVEGLRDLLQGVRDNYNATLANRLNAIMKTLTLFATLLMPLTFLTSVYGMNVGLPFQDDPIAFWVIAFGMVCLTVAMTVYFWFKKWI